MTKYTTTFENLARQSQQADTQVQLLRSLLEAADNLGMKDYNLTVLGDLVELNVPIHEQYLIPLLRERLVRKNEV